MANKESSEVTYGQLGGSVYIPGVGQLGPTLSSKTTGSKVIKMQLVDNLVNLTCKGEGGKTLSNICIPVTYFISMVLG